MKKILIMLMILTVAMLSGCSRDEPEEPTTVPTTEPIIEVTDGDTGFVSEYLTYFVPDGYVEEPEEDMSFLVESNKIASTDFSKGKTSDGANFHIDIFKTGSSDANDVIAEKTNEENKVKEIKIDGHAGFSAVNNDRDYRIICFETPKVTYEFFCPLGNKSNEKAFNELLRMIQFNGK